MSLTLSDATETGSAIYNTNGVIFPMTPQVTDPNFVFRAFHQGGPFIEGPDFGAPSLPDLFSYDITWNAVAGQLNGVSINALGGNGGITTVIKGLGLTGGIIGSDGSYGGCDNGTCQITGFWVPEPGSATLLLSALFGFGLVRRRRRPFPKQLNG